MADNAPLPPGTPGTEFEVVRALQSRFGDAIVFQPTKDSVPTLWVPREQLIEVLRFLREAPKPYVMLFDLSAIDERLRKHREGQPKSDFTVFYHLLSVERNSDVRIKVALQEGDLSVPTTIGIWPNANWYEREIWDMFGIDIVGHRACTASCCRVPGRGTRCARITRRAPPSSIPTS